MTSPPLTPGKFLPHIKPDVILKPWQPEGIRKLALMPSGLLCDDMGMGKSLQMLCVVAIDFKRGAAERVLCVAPVSLKGNWLQEIEDFTNFRAGVLQSSWNAERRRKFILDFPSSGLDFLIVNYEQVVAHVEELNAVGFDIVIADEAHMMKSPPPKVSDRTAAMQKLQAGRFFLLTGTPIEKDVNDLWQLLRRVNPTEWENYWRFRNRYVAFGGYKGKQVVGTKNPQELHERLSSVMVRRLAKDHLPLDEPTVVQEYVDFHPRQEPIYWKLVEENLLDIPADPTPMEVSNSLVRALRLKEVCVSPALVDPSYPDSSYKLDRCVELCEQIIDEGRPVIVFTQFRETLNLLARRLTKEGLDHRTLHGDIKPADRVPIVQAWGEDAKRGMPQALLCMYQVGGTGLNMVEANHVIRVDKLYAPSQNAQAVARAHRIGQTLPVVVHDIIVRGSYEHRIEQINAHKTRTSAEVVDGVFTPAQKRALILALRASAEEHRKKV